jgi:hypothetical protein
VVNGAVSGARDADVKGGLLGGSREGGGRKRESGSHEEGGHVVSWSMSANCQGQSQFFTNPEEHGDSSPSSRPHPPLSRLYPRAASVCMGSISQASPPGSRRAALGTEGWGRDPDLQDQPPARTPGYSPSRQQGEAGAKREQSGADLLAVPVDVSVLGGHSSGCRRSPSSSPVMLPRVQNPPSSPRVGVKRVETRDSPPLGHEPCARSKSCPTPASSPTHIPVKPHSPKATSRAQAIPHIRLCTYGGDGPDGVACSNGDPITVSADALRPRSHSDASVHARRRRQLPRPPLSPHATAEESAGAHVRWADEHSGSPLATSVLLNSIRPRAYSYGGQDAPRKPILKKPYGF